jgi:membrane protein
MNWRSFDDVKSLAVDFYHRFSRDRITSLAAAFAYNTVFAIPALIILTITVAAVLEKATSITVVSQLRDLINRRAPAETQQILTSIVDNAVAKTSGGAASIGLIVTAVLALWSGSNAIGTLIDSFNRAYEVDETRKFIPLKLRVLGLTLLLAIFINLAFVLLVFGQRLGSWIAGKAGLGHIFDWIWNIGRWPASIIAIGLILAILYYAGPNVDQPFKWVSPGSIFATVAWLIATAFFSLYLSISNPGSAYGALGSILVLLFFLYVTGIIFLLGAELNALVLKREKGVAQQPDHAAHPATPTQS